MDNSILSYARAYAQAILILKDLTMAVGTPGETLVGFPKLRLQKALEVAQDLLRDIRAID